MPQRKPRRAGTGGASIGTGSCDGSASGVTCDRAAGGAARHLRSITITPGSSSLKVAGRRGAFSRSLQSVSDQELEGAVKADVRQSGLLVAFALQQRRPEAQEAEVGLFGGALERPRKPRP